MREALHRVAQGAAIPYGYTILTATSGGMLIGDHGAPTAAAAILFVLGAAAAFEAVAVCGRQGAGTEDRAPVLVGLMSAVAAAAGVLVARVLTGAVAGVGAFGVVAFATTLTYLGAEAAQLWACERVRSQAAAPPETIPRAGIHSSMRRHELSVEDLSAFIDGELGWRHRRRVHRHLRDCEPCRRFVEQVSGMRTGFRARSELPVSPELRADLQRTYAEWASARSSS